MTENEYLVELMPDGTWVVAVSDNKPVLVYASFEEAFGAVARGSRKDFPNGATWRISVEDQDGRPAHLHREVVE